MLDRLSAEDLNAVRTLASADGWIASREAPDPVLRPLPRSGGGTILADGGPRFRLHQVDERFWQSLPISSPRRSGVT